MREIKFRIWDKVNKAMVKVVEMDFFRRRMYFTADNKYYSERSLDDVILMQYTGLKDKNREEVYEGDIVKNDYRGIGTVSICETDAYLVKNNLKQICYPLQNVKVEVIGNIYENPELLEG